MPDRSSGARYFFSVVGYVHLGAFAEVGVQVPLEFTTMPAQLEISGDVPTTVRVRVRGRSVLAAAVGHGRSERSRDLKDWKEGLPGAVSPDMVRLRLA